MPPQLRPRQGGLRHCYSLEVGLHVVSTRLEARGVPTQALRVIRREPGPLGCQAGGGLGSSGWRGFQNRLQDGPAE